jgi:NAD(P)-dependent dehydrogenase (short-subunit alcohol dehydrogenase family)
MRKLLRHPVLSVAALAGAYAAGRTVLAYSRCYDFRNRLVIITGGSRGLGLLMARRLADEGAALVICARDNGELADALKELQARAQFATGYTCDLSQPDEIRTLFARIRREVGSVDVLINNAGLIEVGPLETMTISDFRQAMAVHFWAPLLCMQQVLPEMRRRGHGRIVNISSIGGEIAVPHLLPYCASKFALNGLSQGLRAELVKDGLYVTTVCPGLMRTGSPRNARFKGQHRAEYAWFSILGAMPLVSMNADRAARRIVDACRFGRAKITLTLAAKFAEVANAVLPELVADVNSVAAKMMPATGGVGRMALEGHESESAWSPSVLTALNERAALQNNEV